MMEFGTSYNASDPATVLRQKVSKLNIPLDYSLSFQMSRFDSVKDVQTDTISELKSGNLFQFVDPTDPKGKRVIVSLNFEVLGVKNYLNFTSTNTKNQVDSLVFDTSTIFQNSGLEVGYYARIDVIVRSNVVTLHVLSEKNGIWSTKTVAKPLFSGVKFTSMIRKSQTTNLDFISPSYFFLIYLLCYNFIFRVHQDAAEGVGIGEITLSSLVNIPNRTHSGCEWDLPFFDCGLKKISAESKVQYGRWNNGICNSSYTVTPTTIPRFQVFGIPDRCIGKSICRFPNSFNNEYLDPHPGVSKQWTASLVCI